jgi:hypothetical protein
MIRRLFQKEYVIAILMVVFLYICAYVPIAWNYYHGEPGRTYLGFTAFPIDYLGNLSIVQRGVSGFWTRIAFVTSAIPSQGFYIKTIYLLIGNISRVLSVSPLLMFKIVTCILSILFILCIWIILKHLFYTKISRLTAFFLILFSTGITKPHSLKGWDYLRGDVEVFQRTTILQPHYMLGSICSLLSIYYLSQAIDKKNIRFLLLASFFGFVGMWTFPPSIAMIFGCFIVYGIILILQKNAIYTIFKIILYVAIFSLISLLPYLYFSYAGNYFDNNRFLQVENIFVFPLSVLDYFSLIGSIVLPCLIAIPWIIKKKSTFFSLCLSYIIFHPIAVLYLSDAMSVNKIRFIQTSYFIYFAIVGTVGLRECVSFFKRFASKIGLHVLQIFLILLIIIPSIHTYYLSAVFNLDRYFPMFGINFGYPPQEDYSAMIWFASHVKKNSIVLSSTYSGTLLLALAPVRVYASDWFGAVQLVTEAEILFPPMYKYYRGEMSDIEADTFLSTYSISYIYVGTDERTFINKEYNGVLPYKGLKEIYSNTKVKIYQVIPSK